LLPLSTIGWDAGRVDPTCSKVRST
jgi:hypothetical protein